MTAADDHCLMLTDRRNRTHNATQFQIQLFFLEIRRMVKVKHKEKGLTKMAPTTIGRHCSFFQPQNVLRFELLNTEVGFKVGEMQYLSFMSRHSIWSATLLCYVRKEALQITLHSFNKEHNTHEMNFCHNFKSELDVRSTYDPARLNTMQKRYSDRMLYLMLPLMAVISF